MYLDGNPVVHIIDEGTYFVLQKLLPNIHADIVWKTILDSWAAIYTGLPHQILVDQRSSCGEPFANLAQISGVAVDRTGTEAYLSLNIGERYHQGLRAVL